MRNLKRALSLVLAVVMVIGLMVVGASAVSYNDFSDREEIVNKDAVSMLTTLGIIEGQPDGSYNPTGDVDRAQMAKMISVALTNNEDCDTLYQNVNSGLTDISANWARGYINYCYVRGIIAGRGDNTFDPSANVTGVEAAKMLLAALGYNAEIEGLVGPDWALNTAALAQQLGIFRNFTKDVSEPLNRDDAALLIYNALDVELIQEYRNGYAISYDDHRTILSSVFGVIRVEGVVVANEWARLEETDSDEALREGRTTLDNVVWYDSTTANTVVDEGVEVTDPVTFNVTTPVEYMGKAVTMYVEKTTILSNSTVVGVATNDDMNVINFTADGEETVSDFLKGTGVAVDADETEYYVNYGYFANENDAVDWINDYKASATGSDFDLNGVEVQVIDNDDDGTAEYVLYLQETLSEVQRYNESRETLTFFTPERDADEELTGDTASTTIDLEDMVSVERVSLEGVTTTENLSLETEDLILYVQYGGRTYISNPNIVTGTMTRIDRDQSDELFITIDDGENYYQSCIIDVASIVDVDVENFDITSARSDVGFDTLYDFILDSHGYIVAFRPAEDVVTNYALVLDSAWTQNALERGGQIKILMADGTEKTYDLNWDDSADAFDSITNIRGTNVSNAANYDSDERLEYYLGSRDVVQDGSGDKIDDEQDTYATGRAAGSIITYSLNEAGDELTIESVLQGNTFENDPITSIEIDQTHNSDETAGVADNGSVIFMDGDNDTHDPYNLQYAATNGYDNGYGNIRVTGTDGNHTDTRSYAVDLNTVAFYYYKDGEDYVYGVATGWNNMSDVDAGTDVQVIPALEKTTDGDYVASNLAEVILFEAEPNTVAANYMLVLSANAVGKDTLELNVVFEDGTAETITIDDQGDFDEDDDEHFMRAWTYSENADGTYDIGSMWTRANGYADLLINGTIELNGYRHIALPADANVWDVTEVDRGGDDVPEGTFQRNINVNAVVIVSEGQVRTAWIWDLDPNDITGTGWNFSWDLTNYENVYPYMGDWSLWQIQSYLVDETNVRVVGDLTLTGDLVIPEGVILQVEGDLIENGHRVTGDGTLRVRDDYYVDNSTGNSVISTTTQVGGDMLLSESTDINARVGVMGSVVGNGGNTAYNNIPTDAGNRSYDLNVNSAGYLYSGEDIIVSYLTVNGHVEAEDYYIHRGYVYSDDTLIARGSIHLYDLGADEGLLIIGDTTASTAGSVIVGDELTDGVNSLGAVVGTANVSVRYGTLTMNVGADINISGDLAVARNGKVTYEADGAIHYLEADEVKISGEIYVPGTINARIVELYADGKLSVITKPSGLTVNDGELVYLDDEGLEEQPGVDADLYVNNLKIKGVRVENGKVTLTQTDLKNDTLVSAEVEGYSTARIILLDEKGDQVKAIATDTKTYNWSVLITTSDNLSVEIPVEVTVKAASTVTTVEAVYVKGVKATPSESANTEGKTGYTVTLPYATAKGNATLLVVETTDGNAEVTITNGTDNTLTSTKYGEDNKSTLNTGTIGFNVTAENGTTVGNYRIVITVEDQLPQAAHVELLLASSKADSAYMTKVDDDNYTITVADLADVTSPMQYLTIDKEKSVTSTESVPSGVAVDGKENTYVYTFAGIEKGESHEITVEFVEASDSYKVSQDKAALIDELNSGLNVKVPGGTFEAAKKAITALFSDTDWDSTIALTNFAFEGKWEKLAENDSLIGTYTLTFTVKSGNVTETVSQPVALNLTGTAAAGGR